MIVKEVEHYIAVRRALGYQFESQARHLRSFGRFAAEKGDTHVRAATAVAWAGTGFSPDVRWRQLHEVIRLAKFLHADDPAHEIPPSDAFTFRRARPAPYIETSEEIVRLIDAIGELRRWNYNRFHYDVYAALISLLSATGMRISEALNLRLSDVLAGGILRIRQTKFCKSRLIPLHKTVASALDRYLSTRGRLGVNNDYIFPGAKGGKLSHTTVGYIFRRALQIAGIAPGRKRRPRIHDLRHSFATRVLEQCATDRKAVARHFVALSTYLGHGHMRSTYWYLEATPELMTDISAAAEALVGREVA